MKKILLSMAVLAMGVTANAECYVIGEAAGNSGWAPNVGVEIPETEDEGVYSGMIEITGTGYFSLGDALADDWDTFNSTHRYGPEVKDTPIVLDEETPMVKGVDASWKLEAGKYIFTVDFNNDVLVVTEAASEVSQFVITIDGVQVANGATVICDKLSAEKSYFEDEDPDYNEAVIEPHTSIANPTSKDVTFTTTRTVVSQQEGSIFSWCMGTTCVSADVIKGETLLAGESFEGIAAHFEYTAANPEGDGQGPLYGVSEWVITLSNDANPADTFTFNLRFDYNENSAAAVEGIEIDNNVPAEYYNFQGVRVANPEKGMYIVKRGNKVTKEIVK